MGIRPNICIICFAIRFHNSQIEDFKANYNLFCHRFSNHCLSYQSFFPKNCLSMPPRCWSLIENRGAIIISINTYIYKPYLFSFDLTGVEQIITVGKIIDCIVRLFQSQKPDPIKKVRFKEKTAKISFLSFLKRMAFRHVIRRLKRLVQSNSNLLTVDG